MRTAVLPVLLAIALPLAATAQTLAPPVPSPQFFVGLGGTVNTYQRLNGFNTNSFAPVLTAGVQLRTRLALQVGVSYRQQTRSSVFAGQLPDARGQLQPGSWASTNRNRSVGIPVLVRYTIAPHLQERFQVDLLGGVTLVRNSSRYEEAFTYDQTQATVPGDFANANASTDAYLSLGPSARYRVVPHVDLTGDAVFNYWLGGQGTAYPFNNLSANLALGVRYRFAGL